MLLKTKAPWLDVLSTYFEAVSQAKGDDALLEAAHLAKRLGFANVHAMQREHAELYEFPIGGDWTVFKKKGIILKSSTMKKTFHQAFAFIYIFKLTINALLS